MAASGCKIIYGVQASVAGKDCDAIDGLPFRRRAAGRCVSPEARARGEQETCPFALDAGSLREFGHYRPWGRNLATFALGVGL